jgi:hypothetical protein
VEDLADGQLLDLRVASLEQISPEEELLLDGRIDEVGTSKVLSHLRHGNVKVDLIVQFYKQPTQNLNAVAEQKGQLRCELHIWTSELDSPADGTIQRWWWLEAHVIPIRALDGLKKFGFVKIRLMSN